jgi:hypothetical protein
VYTIIPVCTEPIQFPLLEVRHHSAGPQRRKGCVDFPQNTLHFLFTYV